MGIEHGEIGEKTSEKQHKDSAKNLKNKNVRTRSSCVAFQIVL
jgi:hypothetical protein